MKHATNSSSRTLWPLLAVLGSAAGLLALSASALVRSLHDAETRAELMARREAERVADAVRADLTRIETQAPRPDAERFAVRGGGLVVPDAVGWIDPEDAPDAGTLAASGDDRAGQGMAALARREAAGEAAETLASDWRALLADAADEPESGCGARLAAAWFAERHGLVAWRDELRKELRDELGAGAQTAARVGFDQLRSGLARRPPADARVTSLALLDLHAAQVGSEPQSLRSAAFLAALGRLPEARAGALIARAVELGAASTTASVWRAHLADVQARRSALREIRPALARLSAARAPVVLALGSRLVCYVPTGDGDGVGVCAGVRHLVPPLFEAARPAASVSLAWSPGLPDDAVPVVAGVVAVAPVRAAAETPWLLAALVLALAGLFAGALASTLRGVRQQARAQQARSEFLTSVTHELKTPLASLRLLAELLAEGRVADAAQRQEYYDLLASETGRLAALVENVLDLGRTERGERGYDMQVLDVRAWVAETLALFAPVAAREGLSVRLGPAGPEAQTRVEARGDRGALTQALLNVLDNARKYGASPEGIEVDVRGEAMAAAVVVRDHGPGLRDADRERVFERFARGARDASRSELAVPGLGLGLYLARAIVRAHGGDLVAQTPATGRGLVLVFTLPRASSSDAGAEP